LPPLLRVFHCRSSATPATHFQSRLSRFSAATLSSVTVVLLFVFHPQFSKSFICGGWFSPPLNNPGADKETLTSRTIRHMDRFLPTIRAIHTGLPSFGKFLLLLPNLEVSPIFSQILLGVPYVETYALVRLFGPVRTLWHFHHLILLEKPRLRWRAFVMEVLRLSFSSF